MRNRLLQAWLPLRPQFLPENMLLAWASLHGLQLSSGHLHLLQHEALHTGFSVDMFSMGCRGTASLTVVLSRGCRGIPALAPGAPPPLPSQTLVSAELFLLRCPRSSLTLCCAAFFIFLKYPFPEVPSSSSDITLVKYFTVVSLT